MAIPWIAKETGLFARHGFDAEVPLVTGTPRLVQSLIAGDFDYAIPGVTALIRAASRAPIRLSSPPRRTTPPSSSWLIRRPTSLRPPPCAAAPWASPSMARKATPSCGSC